MLSGECKQKTSAARLLTFEKLSTAILIDCNASLSGKVMDLKMITSDDNGDKDD